MSGDEFITVAEAADILQRSVPTAWRVIRQLKIERFKKAMDTRTYVRRTDIEVIAQGTFAPREAGAAA